jgi:sugar phosphate isomerase/epimerase
MLGPYIDEIELLFLESKSTDCLPSRIELEELKTIAIDLSLDYNIHLPTDVSLAASNRLDREEALDAILRVIDYTRKLNPTSWTLHIPYDYHGQNGKHMDEWKAHARSALYKLVGEEISPHALAIENLDYPFDHVRELILDLDLCICMDIGHLLTAGQDIIEFYKANAERIPIMHLHGVKNGRDHLRLGDLSKADGLTVVEILSSYSKTLSVEVFNYENLVSSLAWLDEALRREG